VVFHHPSEKYESQMGLLFPTKWKNHPFMFQTTNQIQPVWLQQFENSSTSKDADSSQVESGNSQQEILNGTQK